VSAYSAGFSPGAAASATRVCNRSLISSAEYARRLRSARAITAPVAATPASPASPAIFHQRIS
jgi:hypothetical protein